MVRALAAAAPCSSKQCSLATTRYACLQQRSQQQQQQKHLHDQYRVRRHAPDLGRFDALSRSNLRRFRGAETARAAGLMLVVEIHTQKESTGCHVGLRQASTWGYASMGHVSQRGFARRACCYCLLLLVLLAAAAPGAVAARGYTHELQSTRVYRQPEATFSNGQAATSLVYATLGASLANPKRPESFRRTECSGRISYPSYLALLYFASQK